MCGPTSSPVLISTENLYGILARKMSEGRLQYRSTKEIKMCMQNALSSMDNGHLWRQVKTYARTHSSGYLSSRTFYKFFKI